MALALLVVLVDARRGGFGAFTPRTPAGYYAFN